MKISQKQTVGVSKFVRRQKKGSGKTFSSLSFNKLAEYSEKELNNNNFKQGYRDGVILIEIEKKLNDFFTCPLIKINKKTKLEAVVKKRRKNENNYISIKALNGKPLPIGKVELVLYRSDVLDEGNERSTNKNWELISFFGIPKEYKSLPMGPVTMMRNQLIKTGGTKANYSSDDWACSVDFWQNYALLK